MPHDVFISYAHHDNVTHDGWVEMFCQKLRDHYRSKTGKGLDIFFDKDNLIVGNALPERFENALKQTSIFIPILSPSYLNSAWCRREFMHFLEVVGDNLLLENGASRIIPVRLIPFENYWDDQAADIIQFLREKDFLYLDFHQDSLPFSPKDKEFPEKIHESVKSIEKLQPLIKAQSATFSEKEPDTVIFLAQTSSASQGFREQILKELQQQRKYNRINIRILPDDATDARQISEQSSDAGWKLNTEKHLAAANFSLHFLDDVEGKKPTDSTTPIPHLQYGLAKEAVAKNPDFRLLCVVKSDDEGSEKQAAFLKDVLEDTKNNERCLLLNEIGHKAIKDYLLELIETLKKQQASKAEMQETRTSSRVFFVHDHRDRKDPLHHQIDDLMYGQRWEVLKPVFREDDPNVNPDETFKASWLVSDKAVVLLRNATAAWCNAKKVELIKIGTEKKPPFQMAICVAEPDTAQRIRDVRSHEFEIIDCAKPEFTETLLKFLNSPNNG